MDTYKKCAQCTKDMNVLDDHPDCVRHRLCTEEFSCNICKAWTPGRWIAYNKMVDKALAKTTKPVEASASSETRVRINTGVDEGNVQNLMSLPSPSGMGDSTQPTPPPSGQVRASQDQSLPPSGQWNPQTAFVSINPAQMPSLSGQTQMHLFPVAPPSGQPNFMNWSEQAFNAFIDSRIRLMTQPNISTTVTSSGFKNLGESVNAEANKQASNRRFNRFERETRSVSPDILDLADARDNEFVDDDDQSLDDSRSQDNEKCDETESTIASIEVTGSWKNFITKLASELKVPLEADKPEQEYASYVSEHLQCNKESNKIRPPLEGSSIQAFMNVDKEWQTRGKICAFKARDDERYAVSSDHFTKFCKVPSLDSNIEEGITDSKSQSGKGLAGNAKGRFRFSNKNSAAVNSEFRKVDMSARLLLRQISYGSMITSYLDTVQSDDDKTEALQALVQLFNSMADVSSRVIVTAVGARRSLYLQDMAFKNKATESKLQNLSTIGSDLFLGKYFEVLHGSAENIRDAKETQHLRGKDSDPASKKRKFDHFTRSDARGSEASASKIHRTSPVRPNRSGILQHFLPSSQEGRRISTNTEPQSSEYLSRCAPFQNGDIKKYSASHRSKRLGTVSRSEGCLPSHSHVSSTPQISEILLAGSALPIQSNAIRVGHSAKNFYQTDGNYRELPQKETDSSLHVFRRLANQESRQDTTIEAVRRSPSVNSEFRSNCQCSEVEHEPITSGTLSGVSVPHTKGPCFSFRGEVQEDCGRDYYNIRNKECCSSENFTTLGFDGFSHRLTPLARLHMRPIQFYLLSFWRPHKDSLTQSLPVRKALLRHLEWWKKRPENIFRGVTLQEKQPHNVTLCRDASSQGWGAHLNDLQISGTWSSQESSCHINWLEMRAVQLALIHFESILLKSRVLLRCDNSTVVSYFNREGGTKSFQLCCLVWEIFQWSKSRNIVIRAAHIPGKKNVLADDLSRGRQGVRITEWSLKQELVNKIFMKFSILNIDLFATRENRKLPVFCSPFPDQLAWATDALSVTWKGMFAYAFPPPVLIPQVLQKVRKEPCVLVLIAPHSPRQSWYPILLELLVDIPRKLPITEDMLTQKKGQIRHANPESLNLVAWKISSLLPVRESFLQELRSISSRQGEPQHRGCIRQDLQFTEAGVIDGIFLHI